MDIQQINHKNIQEITLSMEWNETIRVYKLKEDEVIS